VGDPVTIISYFQGDEAEGRAWKPIVVQVDKDNRLVKKNG
jgi:aspartate 1-decarboxylase